ncbi:uncharacterized protein LOC127766668 [Oryza glaberrima]|nr:uncharacterized protein LOC127766668 [Oryza glaberrima]
MMWQLPKKKTPHFSLSSTSSLPSSCCSSTAAKSKQPHRGGEWNGAEPSPRPTRVAAAAGEQVWSGGDAAVESRSRVRIESKGVSSVKKRGGMAMTGYKYQAQELMRDYLLADPLVPYTSVLVGIALCKMAYDLTRVLSSFYFKGYSSLTKIQRVEWNNRGMSSAHAIFITAISLYLVMSTDLFSDRLKGPITFRNSIISTFALGVSVGYFIADLAMIFWLYPSLGGMEYIVHHTLSLVAIAYTMLSGEGQFYTYMVLISETTTPEINLRWFLDTAGLKKSSAYLVNGILMFVAWLVARILLFIYVFYHIYLHYSQVMQMHAFGYYLTFIVPSVLFVMNTMWFMKILKGVKKTLGKWS